MAIERKWPFVNSTGSLRGVKGSNWETGMLNSEETALYRDAIRKGDVAFTVFSYDTPIGWADGEGNWYRVKEKFSQTTSCHSGMIPLR